MSEKVDHNSDQEERLLELCRDVRRAIDQEDIDSLKKVSAMNKDYVNVEFRHEHDGDCMGTTPFMYTCFQYRGSRSQKLAEILEYLASVGADVNLVARNPADHDNRTTPLIAAINWDDVESVRILLSFGADTNARDDTKAFPLMEALWHAPDSVNHVKITELLLLKGANVDAPTGNGRTLLQDSIDDRNIFACQMLAKAGANLSVCGEDGVTPLHSAAQWRDRSVIKAFVDAGADIHAKTAGLGQTPLDVYWTSVDENHAPLVTEIVLLLQDKEQDETRPGKRKQSKQNPTKDKAASAKRTNRSSSQSERLPSELTRLQQLATQLLGPQFNLVPYSEDDEQERITRIRSLIRAEHFSSKVNYSLDSAADDLIYQRKRSVCKIESPGGYGSGFLIGKNTILTNNHIYEMMEKASKQPDERSADPRNYRAIFVLSEHFEVVCQIAPKQPLSRDGDLDYAIVELVPVEDNNSTSDIIPLGQFISDNLEKDGMVVVVGHPGGGRKKIDFCPISGLDEKYIIHVLFGNPNVPRPDVHRATYHTGAMFHGSSGSAGFDRNGNLVLMHTRGFFPIENQTSLIEEGVRLSSIREHARQNLSPEVFNEIFPQRQGGFSFGH
ncbi:uncharacterized protein LOC144903717 isoform X1 [Branchiostoma floridae x Branchiostoma belcheri]